MRMIRYLLVGLVFAFFYSNPMVAQTAEKDNFTANAFNRFQHFAKIPYEKVYLHLDKPYYSAGENIWYSAYLVDGMNTVYSPYSRYIYVELISKSDSVLMRYKLMKDSLGLTGNIALPSDFPAGDYRLRAYSWWMQNAGKEYFFQKNIHIGNEIDKTIQSSITYSSMVENQINAEILFHSDKSIALAKRSISYSIYEGSKLVRTHESTIDNMGRLKFGFEMNPQSTAQYRIQITINDNQVSYKKDFFVPKKNNGVFECQFFPEGGNLLNNGVRNIAFKAVGSDGYSVEIAGKIVNQAGDSITSFASIHKGMGMFSLSLYDSTSVNYFARVHIKGKSQEYIFPLPEVRNTGVGINVLMHGNRIYYKVIAADKKEQIGKKMYVVIQQRGLMCSVVPIIDTLQWERSLTTNQLQPGILHFVLLDEAGNALSQRIVFVNKPGQSVLSVTSDKMVYAGRSPVYLKLGIQNANDTAVAGQFSVAVTADKAVKQDTLADNICSSLLLTSDLKGFIEDPGYYFHNYPAEINPKIDLVMLTHGWTRFDVPSVLKGNEPLLPYFMEKGQSFSGKITNFFGRGAKDAQLIALGMKSRILKTVTADEKGQFVVDGIAFPDSTTFLVQARSKRGHDTVELQMDKETFPEVTAGYPFKETKIASYTDDYMKMMSQKFHYEGGERVFHLKEVTVTASRKKESDENPLYAGMGNPVRTEEIEKRYMGRTVLDIIRDYPGVMVTGYP